MAGQEGAITGAAGAVTGGIGSGAIKIGGELLGKVGASAGLGALGGELSYLASESTKMVLTGGKEGKITLRGILLSAGFGAVAGLGSAGLAKANLKPSLGDYSKMTSYKEAIAAMLPAAAFTATVAVAKHGTASWVNEGHALISSSPVRTLAISTYEM